MGREVLLDGKQLDVMTDDNLEITLENPALQSISNFKMSYTNTYTLPLTDKNRAIFDAIDNVNAETSFVRDFHSLYEYRDGTPVIEDARVRIKTAKPNDEQIEIEVIWGALKSIDVDLGKENINDLESVMIPWNDTVFFTTQNFTVGFLSFMSVSNMDAGHANLVRTVKYTLPSVRVDYIIDKIFSEKVTTPYLISDAIREEFKKYYIPCTTMNASVVAGSSRAVVAPLRTDRIYLYGWQNHIRFTLKVNTLPKSGYNDTNNALTLVPNKNYSVKVELTVNHPNAVTGDILEILIGYPTGTEMVWIPHKEFFTGTTCVVDHVGKIEIGSSTAPINYVIAHINKIHSGYAELITFGNDGDIATCEGTFTFWLETEGSVSFGQPFDAILNLPKISQLDFLKNILAITGSYVYFKNGVINFDLIDNILKTSPLNIEKWITTLRSESIEYTYEDYAQTNIYKYLDDDIVNIDANSVILIEDRTLEDEKDVISLKLGASDAVINDIASVYQFDQPTNPSEDPIFNSSLKPRILTHRISATDENPPGAISRRVGTFGGKMLWDNILKDKYKLFRSILADPKVVEVELYMQKGDIYLINANSLYYFWGSNWILIDLTVSTDGSGTGKFIQLN